MRLPESLKTACLLALLVGLFACVANACAADTVTAVPKCPRPAPARVDLDTMPRGSFVIEIRVCASDTTCAEASS